MQHKCYLGEYISSIYILLYAVSQFSHTFEGYGVGVRKISFKYGELKGLKMSRTCVSVKIPEKAFVLSKATWYNNTAGYFRAMYTENTVYEFFQLWHKST